MDSVLKKTVQQPQIRVLIIEDDEDDFVLVRDMLKEVSGPTFELEWVENYASALAVMMENRHDVCLLDYRLGERNGLELLRALKQQGCKCAVIFLTGQGDYQVDVEAMEAGASDYLIKGQFDASLLERAIRYAIQSKRNQEALRRAQDELEGIVEERTAELARTNIALRLSESRLNSILKTVPDIIYRLDKEGRITFISEAVREYGYNPDRLLRRPMVDLVHPQDRPLAYHRINERRTGGRATSDLEIRLLAARDGGDNNNHVEEPVFLIAAEGIYASSQPEYATFQGTQGIARDITRYKKTETEKQRLEERLHHAQRMEAIGALAGGIAHEFNNALAGITGNIELLQMKLETDLKNRQYLRSIENSANRMVELTKQLLAYAQAGKYNPQRFSFSRLVTETLPLVQYTLNPNVRVLTDLPADIPPVQADKTQLQMVLSAVLKNAVEAIEQTGHIRIITRREEIGEEVLPLYPGLEKGTYATLVVTDTGKGMDKKTLDRVFDPFFTTKFHGRGLGMAAAYGIVKNHNGWIHVESEVEKGTRVKILLPTAA